MAVREGRWSPPGPSGELSLALGLAAIGKSGGSIPLEYVIDQVARRYGIPPWDLDTDDPRIVAWYHLGRFFNQLESEARPQKL